MAGPALAMAACIVTMALAAQGFDAQILRDGGSRKGLVVSKPVVHGESARERGVMPDTERETP